MTSTAYETETTAPTKATDLVFEALLSEVLGGTYPARARLPSERELSQQLGASQSTLRDALRRLTEWSVIETRPGSGATVRDAREWSIEVLPAFVRYSPDANIGEVIADLLALRHAILRAMLTRACGRMTLDGIALARTALVKAAALSSGLAFVEADLDFFRTVSDQAKMLPATWLVNRLSSVYMDLAKTIGPAISAPDDYVESYERILAALSAGNEREVGEHLDNYIRRCDGQLLAVKVCGNDPIKNQVG